MLQNINKISPLPKEVIEFLHDTARIGTVERIIVFGSRAIGDYETYSDLDLAIDAPTIRRMDWLKLKEFAAYDLRTVIRVSLVHFSSNPNKLKERITETGKIIYARK